MHRNQQILSMWPSKRLVRDALTAERWRPFRWLVRAGFVGRGVTYGLIAALTIALALGAGSHRTAPNQQGALDLVLWPPLGRLALAIISLGLLAYALWKFGLALFGAGPEGRADRTLKDRIANFGGGLVYVAFCSMSVRVLIGSAGSQTSEQNHAASGVLGWPGGPLLVGAAGAGLLAISAFQIYEAIRGRFARDNKTGEMATDERRVFLVLGRIGLTARAVVFALVGYFLLRTAVEFRADGVGVDGALARLHRQPFGPWLLALVAAGLLVFAVFSFFEARYQRL